MLPITPGTAFNWRSNVCTIPPFSASAALRDGASNGGVYRLRIALRLGRHAEVLTSGVEIEKEMAQRGMDRGGAEGAHLEQRAELRAKESDVRDLASERLVLVAAGPEPLAVAREDERPRDVRDGTDHVDKVRLRGGRGGGRGGGRRRALPPRAPLVAGAGRVEQEVVALFLDRPARGDQVWLRVERTAGPSEDVAERLFANLPALLGVHHVAVAEEDQADAIVVSDPVAAREATRRIELDEIGEAEAGDAALEARR